ncbi:hypothetical protein TWF970_001390 [Orbilia oligospora]|uniref:Uncharacterized protein n=1 Tax=Orbilia oligospora TaxID=2813651 RepID=A0A7C8VI50_ORBOL|nr:hypothetical protein TWF970_001390 [Orbilia oligospora]
MSFQIERKRKSKKSERVACNGDHGGEFERGREKKEGKGRKGRRLSSKSKKTVHEFKLIVASSSPAGVLITPHMQQLARDKASRKNEPHLLIANPDSWLGTH